MNDTLTAQPEKGEGGLIVPNAIAEIMTSPDFKGVVLRERWELSPDPHHPDISSLNRWAKAYEEAVSL